MDSVLDPENGIALIVVSPKNFLRIVAGASQFGFEYAYPRPIVWIKTGLGIAQNKFSPASCYDMMVFLKRKVDTPILKPAFPDWVNIRQLPLSARLHPLEKPVALWRYWLEQIALPDFTVVDPWCHAGETLEACYHHGIPQACGIQPKPEFQKMIQQRLAAAQASIELPLVLNGGDSDVEESVE